MAKKESENYLDFVPVRSAANLWTEKNGVVTIDMLHDGLYDKLAQKLFHTPRVSHIDLDEYGSFLWQRIDGEQTVGQLGGQMKAQFGEAAEPLYDRLVKYMQILHNNGFVLFKGKDKMK